MSPEKPLEPLLPANIRMQWQAIHRLPSIVLVASFTEGTGAGDEPDKPILERAFGQYGPILNMCLLRVEAHPFSGEFAFQLASSKRD
jgi:hypothetical protein